MKDYVLPHSSGGQKFKIKVPAWVVLSEGYEREPVSDLRSSGSSLRQVGSALQLYPQLVLFLYS